MLAICCWARELPLRVVSSPSETLLEKADISLVSVTLSETASGSGMGHVSSSPFSSRTPSVQTPQIVCMLTQSLSSYVPQPCCVQKAPLPWCPPSPLALTLFLPPFLQHSVSSEGRDLMGTSRLGLRIPSSHNLCILSGPHSNLTQHFSRTGSSAFPSGIALSL